MATSEMQNKEKARSRVLIVASVAMLLLACGVFGSLFYLQRKAATSESVAEQRIAAEKAALEPTKEVAEERVARLEMLREKWRPWALKHKKELKRMLNAKASDRTVLMAVYDAIPAIPKNEDAGFSGKELNSALQGMSFSWQPGAKIYANFASSEENQKVKSKDGEGRKFIERRLQQHFATLHDIELSGSINTGRTHVNFWASGRITRGTWIDNPNTSAGQPSLIEAPLEELQPPYDFLQ